MGPLVEKLLGDVDQDIREFMLSPADPQPSPYMSTMVGVTDGHVYKNWELLQDPLFFIIQWQELRHENRHNAGA